MLIIFLIEKEQSMITTHYNHPCNVVSFCETRLNDKEVHKIIEAGKKEGLCQTRAIAL